MRCACISHKMSVMAPLITTISYFGDVTTTVITATALTLTVIATVTITVTMIIVAVSFFHLFLK